MPKSTPIKPRRLSYKISGLRLRIPRSPPMGMKRERYVKLMRSSQGAEPGLRDEKLAPVPAKPVPANPKETK
jgi:hypothetical protein